MTSHAHPQQRIVEQEAEWRIHRQVDSTNMEYASEAEVRELRRLRAFLADPDTSIHKLRSGKHQISHPRIQTHVGKLGEMVEHAAEQWENAGEER